MSHVLAQPTYPEAGDAEEYKLKKQLPGLFSGEPSWAAPLAHTGLTDAAAYALTLQNLGAGGKHLNIPGKMIVNDGGIEGSNLNIAGTSSLNILNVAGAAAFASTVAVTGAATFASTVGVTGNLSTNGNLSAGDNNGDVHTFVGLSNFRNSANTVVVAEFDAANARATFGSATSMSSDTTPSVQVVGRLYVGPESASDVAVQIRRSAAASVGWTFGVDASQNLLFVDDGNTPTFLLGDVASAYQAEVRGNFVVTDTGVAVFEAGLTGIGFYAGAQVAQPAVAGTVTGGTLAQLQTAVMNLANALGASGVNLITNNFT